jgi:hypothetical protein
LTPRFRFRRFDDETYRWILLGGNNRLIGMAADGSGTLPQAILNVDRVRAAAAAATFSFTVGEDRRWYWRLEDASGPVAGSVSGFERRLDARRAVRRFCRAAATATVQLGIVTVPDRVRERPGPSRDPRFPTGLAGSR